MTAIASAQRTAALRRAAVRATLAPSVHNTQPWKLRVGSDGLSLSADRSRQLPVLDPTARQLLISCGCAVLNARVSLAGDGFRAEVIRTAGQDPLVTLRIVDGPADVGLAALDNVIELRQTNRRQFTDPAVPEQILNELEAVVAAEDAWLFVVRDPDQRLAVATLSQYADDIENLNPAYRAELRAWTSDDPLRRDGVPPIAVPHVDGSAQDEVPIRDFDTRGVGGLPAATRSSKQQCLVLLGTDSDTEAAWLRAGEALERMLLEITRHGYTASPLTQVTEVPSARAQLRGELGLLGYPHVLIRIGRAPKTPASRRRRLVDVLVEQI